MARRKNLVAVGDEHDSPEIENQQDNLAPDGANPAPSGTSDIAEWYDDDEETSPGHPTGWIIPAIAILAIAGWSGFFAFAHQQSILGRASPLEWSDLITSWAVPVLLVVTLWLLAMRSSRREAGRFADAANALSVESERLEKRLVTVNRELSLAREFIAAQSRDLESLGRVASERLSQNADRLVGLIQDNGKQVDNIASVSASALDNMGKLRDELPVIANSARDVANQIGNAGNTAHGQIDELVSGFKRLNEFGQVSHEQVEALTGKIDNALSEFDTRVQQLDQITAARFAQLQQKSEAFGHELATHETDALAAMQRRAANLQDELNGARSDLEQQEQLALASLQQRFTLISEDVTRISGEMRQGETDALAGWEEAIERLEKTMRSAIQRVAEIDSSALDNTRKRLSSINELATRMDNRMAARMQSFDAEITKRDEDTRLREEASLQSLQARMNAFDANVSEKQEEQLAHVSGLAERGEALAARLAQLSGQMDVIAAQGGETSGALSDALDHLGSRISASRDVLSGTDNAISELTDASVRLLEILQSSAQQTREDLPQAISAAEETLGSVEQRTQKLALFLSDANARGQELSEYVINARQQGAEALETVENLQASISHNGASQIEQVETLRLALSALNDESDMLALRAQGELTTAIEALRTASSGVLEEIGGNSAEAVHSLARKIAEESGEALDRALKLRASESIGHLEQAAAHASGVAREAAVQLRDQLSLVNELASNLETRVAQARDKAEEQIDNDFARRMALITESLNSNSIDIAKALSNDVTDTAWAAYLRGDRGIFTRRAVRLLENSEAREVASIYEDDTDFREHVSRYIHDFEGMLRTMLSTRDGKALAVTLLSSDMGKLYVVLAQAIDRLRD